MQQPLICTPLVVSGNVTPLTLEQLSNNASETAQKADQPFFLFKTQSKTAVETLYFPTETERKSEGQLEKFFQLSPDLLCIVGFDG